MNERARRSAVLLLRLESVLLISLALYLAISAAFKGVTAPGALAGEIAFSLTGALGLFFASRGFARFQSYGRAPALLANLIALGVAYFMISGKFFLVGIPLALLAIATIYSAIKGFKLE